jgi:hypothetical protein
MTILLSLIYILQGYVLLLYTRNHVKYSLLFTLVSALTNNEMVK